MHRIWKRILCTVCAVTIISACVPVGFAIERNPATDWFSGKYGIDGPVVNLDMTDYENFNASVWDYDVEYAMQVVEETGADYLLMPVMYVAGVMPAPNPVWDEITGAPPGWYCSTRDLIEEMYQALNARGKKLMLYATADGPWKCPDVGKLGTQFSAEYFENWHKTIRYFSEIYGDKIAGWWIDGAYSDIGYDNTLLSNLEAACKAGNPNAIVSFNNGYHVPYDNRDYINDYTAGETYGLDFIPDGRWINGIQFHKWLPVFEYGNPGSAYTANELAEYVKAVTDQGGAITFALAYNTDPNVTEVENADWSEIDPIQLEVLRQVKTYVKDGVPLPNKSFDGSKRIAAGSCTEMVQPTTEDTQNVIHSQKISPRIIHSNRKGGGLMWTVPQFLDEYVFTKRTAGKDRNFNGLYAGYQNVSIPEGTNNIALAVKMPSGGVNQRIEPCFQYRLDVRLDSLNGETIASLNNVGAVDFFQFSNGPVYTIPVLGYCLVNIPIAPISGIRNIYLTGVMRDTGEYRNLSNWINAAEFDFVDNGVLSIKKHNDGYVLSSFDGGDAVGYHMDFGADGVTRFKAEVATQAPYAGQTMDLYIDGRSAQLGGTLIGSIKIPDTGSFFSFSEVSTSITKVTGEHDVYLVGRGAATGIGTVKQFIFTN